MNRLSVLGQKLDKNVWFEIETIRTATFITVRSNIQTFKHSNTIKHSLETSQLGRFRLTFNALMV